MYTRSEKVHKTHTIADAIKAAEYILSTRRITSLNMKQIVLRSHSEAITLAELNLIADTIVSDTLFFA